MLCSVHSGSKKFLHQFKLNADLDSNGMLTALSVPLLTHLNIMTRPLHILNELEESLEHQLGLIKTEKANAVAFIWVEPTYRIEWWLSYDCTTMQKILIDMREWKVFAVKHNSHTDIMKLMFNWQRNRICVYRYVDNKDIWEGWWITEDTALNYMVRYPTEWFLLP